MSLSLEQKKSVVSELKEQLAKAQVVILADYRGLTVEKMTELRKKARESGVYLRVIKNTLVKRAVDGGDFSELSKDMVGPSIFGISSDPVSVAKIFSEFAKFNEPFEIKSGAISGKLMTVKDIQSLASLPGREELLSRLAGTMQAPIAKFVRTINEVPTKFVRGLVAIKTQRTV